MFDSGQLQVFQQMHSGPAAFAQGEKSEGSAPLA